MTDPEGGGAHHTDYRIAHLQERLAREGSGELGLRIEARGSAVLVTGAVPTAGCRDDILRVIEDELGDAQVHTDIVLTEAAAPEHPEDLS